MAEEQSQYTPHPLITSSTLWAVDIPSHLKWPKLLELLRLCGEVASGGRSTSPEGRRRWAITFSDIYHAEMALATLNGLPVPDMDPPWNLALSHTDSLENALPTEPLCAQFVKVPGGTHPLLNASAQEAFEWFRSAGPLVAVRTNVNVGYPQLTVRALNLGPNFKSEDVNETFGKYGTVTHCRMMREGEVDCHCDVSYRRQEEAFAAIAGLNNEMREQRKIRVRIFDLGVQSDFRPLAGANVRAPHQQLSSGEAEAQSSLASAEAYSNARAPSQASGEAFNDPPPTYSAVTKAQRAREDVRGAYHEKLATATRRREEAAAVLTAVRRKRLDVEARERAARATLAQAFAVRDEASRLLADATVAAVAAEAHKAQMLKAFSALAVAAAEADDEHKAVAARSAAAAEREAALAVAHELAEKEEKELVDAPPLELEEARRRESLQEMIRQMRGLRGGK
ncbi:hypothetical protein PHLGIDRAFT_494959 [Phlebiopsis gigantea 11061_1 CR5-6]|uniref:RRM domain-containing protein n=1 Tax=Phlebiopsis gigantea (strain 11061_1 CR5-6) TaxID=745531 RepID=A0A0C3NGT7_PHLG1|nr:hypothetical protein PHLGIDRAFT_494959 [Phlebiopsis gigantea 11061_1 CR5-6]